MRVLIIGGTGIISTGITRQLVERNDDVVLYKRGQTSSLVEGDYTTITGNRKDFSVFKTDTGSRDLRLCNRHVLFSS